MKTIDVSSITNSVMQAWEKECRKNGITPAFHRLYKSHRTLVEGMVAMTVADHINKEGKKS